MTIRRLLYLCRIFHIRIIRSRDEYINIIRSNAPVLRNDFGIKALSLFGSVARNEQTLDSDVDICVDMAPKLFLIIRLKRYLESILGVSVDIVRVHNHLNSTLKSEIERDGIPVF